MPGTRFKMIMATVVMHHRPERNESEVGVVDPDIPYRTVEPIRTVIYLYVQVVHGHSQD
jgi:hypothetical protein